MVTADRRHPAVDVADFRLDIIEVDGQVDFRRLFGQLAGMDVQNLTVQSGGTLNATLVRSDLINYVSVVVAPVLVGGRSTPTLLDGDPLERDIDLRLLRPLVLLSVRGLDHSCLHLRYAVASRVMT